MKDGTRAPVSNNGYFGGEQISTSKFSQLLASSHRDFLLSPTGAQVLRPSFSLFFVSDNKCYDALLFISFNFLRYFIL